jgi:hypothetical protein
MAVNGTSVQFPTSSHEWQLRGYSVEKLGKNGELISYRKPKHSELRIALSM